MLLLLEAAENILLGTISTSGCNGPLLFWTELAKSCFEAAVLRYSSLKVSWKLSGTSDPGWRTLTNINPILTATAVVLIYRAIVFQPILESFVVSESEATPVIREETTSGTAISLRRFKKIVPNGDIKSDVKPDHPLTALAIP